MNKKAALIIAGIMVLALALAPTAGAAKKVTLKSLAKQVAGLKKEVKKLKAKASVPGPTGTAGAPGLSGTAGSPGLSGTAGSPGPTGPAGSPDSGAQILTKLLTVDGSGSGLDADSIDGVSSGSLMQRTLQSGQTISGQISQTYTSNPDSFMVAGGSYPVPLPTGTAQPTLEVLTTTSATCPGIGQSTAGRLCVYRYNSSNIGSVQYGGGSAGINRYYGFSLDVFPTTAANPGWLMANWAYELL